LARGVRSGPRYGHTSAASLPIAMAEAWEHGQIRPGQRLLLTAFGAGLAWGSGGVDWTLPNPAEPFPGEPTQPAPLSGGWLPVFGPGVAWGSVVVAWTHPNPAEPFPEEPTQPAMPIVRGLL